MGHDFRGSVLRVVSYDSEGITGDVENGIMTGNVAAERTMRDLQYILNFKIVLHRWGQGDTDVMKQGYFETGIAAELSADKADLGLGYFFVTMSRVKDVSPLLPLISEKIYGYFVPPEGNLHANVYMTSFGPDLFLALFSVMFLIAVLSTACSKLNKRTPPNNSISYLDGYLIISSLISQQGFFLSRFGLSTRLKFIILSGELLSSVMFSAYTANLLLVMTTEITFIKTFDDLIQYKYEFHGKPGIYDLIRDPKYPISFHLGETTQESVLAIFKGGRDAYVGVSPTSVNGKHLLWELESYFNSSYVDDKICETLDSVPLQKANVFVASTFYTKKNSWLREPLNHGILKIHQVGLMKRYFSYSTKAQIECRKPSPLRYLAFSDVESAFQIMGVVYAFVCIAFILEILLDYVQRLRGVSVRPEINYFE